MKHPAQHAPAPEPLRGRLAGTVAGRCPERFRKHDGGRRIGSEFTMQIVPGLLHPTLPGAPDR
jgi:hypothetical protein